jgi:hypothetical protein
MTKAAVRLILVVVILPAIGVIAEAQQPGKVSRIGLLCNSTASGTAVLSIPVRVLERANKVIR